ncbi:coiled-coil domain-containing protein 181-like isoform X2 [Littorina saxatilis]|uniref:coiled-coil domain-containing protein 181-like isoform X2 n=1 Tax=Littorina saxatilis TaxID=31220 RepID=UPI0038B5E669
MVDTARGRESDALKSLAWSRFGIKMDLSESSEKQASDQQQKSNGTPAKSDLDYAYEDDFEELDSFIKEKSGDSSGSKSATVNSPSDNSSKKDVFHNSDSQQEKGQQESSDETPSKKESLSEDSQEQSASLSQSHDDAQSDDSEPEPEGDVLFTEDQQRAMLELMAQKLDSGDYSDDPPEYNVKERLKELNAELAMEPDPDNRAHRVGFKAELVDLVAPPPDVSDDEDSPRKTLTDGGDKNKEQGEKEEKKKQFVVERDGKFDVVADNELTATERAMFNIPGEEEDSKGNSSTQNNQTRAKSTRRDNQTDVNNSNASRTENQHPAPPSKPRPNTANGYSRRTVRPSQSPRPQTASSNRYSSHNSSLQDFNYTSEYAMSPNEKERAYERARLRDQQRKEEEDRRKQEEEYRRQEAKDCFQAWLNRKRDTNHKKKQEDEERKKRDSTDDRSWDSETESEANLSFPLLEPFEPIVRLKSKENEEAYKGWLKEKQGQLKREKLLKKREEQEIKDGYYVRSREECDMAYKEWLKQKYAELKRQKIAEKQRVRSFRSQFRRTRKQQMMVRAVRQSQAFRYVDYYGYRF